MTCSSRCSIRWSREFDGQIDRTALAIKLEKEGLPETALSFPGKVLADPADGTGCSLPTPTTTGSSSPDWRTETSSRSSVAEARACRWVLRASPRSINPQGLALSDDGSRLYIADTENHLIRMVDFPTGQVSTLAGTGQKGTFPPTGGPARRPD